MTVVVAQVGCGYWGPNLLRNLSEAQGCRVKSVVEPSLERQNFVRRRFPHVQPTADWQSVLDDPEVQAVVIATPAATHAELTLQALRAGKHVLVEKPLATSVADVDLLAASCGEQVLMVGHTFLYNEAVRSLHRLMNEGELGTVYYMTSERLNLGQVRSDVNVWWNLAPHDISIILYLFGGELPESVTATGLSYLQPGIEDVAFAQFRWSDGRAAHLHVSWLDPDKSRKMTIVGDRKMAIYDDIADHKLRIIDRGVDFVPQIGQSMDFDGLTPLRPVHRHGDVWLPKTGGAEPLSMEVAHFLNCIRTGTRPLTDIAHARQVVAILEAGDSAMRSQQTVRLADVAGTFSHGVEPAVGTE